MYDTNAIISIIFGHYTLPQGLFEIPGLLDRPFAPLGREDLINMERSAIYDTT